MKRVNFLNPLKTSLFCLILCHVLLWLPLQARGQGNETPRQDYSVGTVHEGIVMEQDPVTKDRVIMVTPPPREENQNQQPPVLLIQPEIKVRSE